MLRPYQAEALQASLDDYTNGIKRQLIQLPTGTGKTILFANLLTHHKFNKKLMVLLHREELAKQAIDKIHRYNPDYSIGLEMGKSRALPSNNVVVASVQSLGREGTGRLNSINPEEYSAIVIDECHRSTGASYKNVLDHFQINEINPYNILLLGVTATPNRSDGLGMALVFDKIVYQMPILTAINEGWLVDLKAFRIRTNTDLDAVHTLAGDFNQGELSLVVNTDSRNRIIAEEWLKYGEQRKTLAFTVDIAHAVNLAKSFRDRGICAEAVWGADPERASKLKRHRNGETLVLFNSDLLTEGYDDWSIQCVLLAKPTKSQLLYTQLIGRGTRLQDGITNIKDAIREGKQLVKTNCIIMDVTDNTSKHNLATINSIFGLPRNLKVDHKLITPVVKEIEEAKLTKPGTDFSKLENVEDIKSYLEEIDLFEIKYAPEVLNNSEFQWILVPEDTYKLRLPDKKYVTISKNLIDLWDVVGKVEDAEFSKSLPTLEEAFKFADNMIKMFGKSILNFIRRENKAKWAKHPITPAQIKAIKYKLRRDNVKITPDYSKMTKDDGSKLILKLYGPN